jgi:putative FmdB family regulatory protein
MPIYEYNCHSCDTKFEMMRPFSQSSSPAVCPTCKSKAERVLSTFACFTTNESGSASPVAGTSSCSCGSCSGGSCGTCHAG